MTARRGLQLGWVGSWSPGCARAQDLDGHDALNYVRSQVTSCGPGPRVLPTPLGRFYIRAPPWRRDLGAKKRRQEGSARVGSPKIAGYGCHRLLARFWGGLALTSAGARLLPLRALARLASQEKQRKWERAAPTKRPAIAGRFYKRSPIASLRIGPRSAPLERSLALAKASLGALCGPPSRLAPCAP